MSLRRKLGLVVVAVLAAAAFPTLVAGERASPRATKKTTVKSAPKSAGNPASPTLAPRSPITIGITSHIRHGKLVVLLDDVPVFSEEFRKPTLRISQTTIWDPVPVAAGKYKLSAKVYGEKGKVYLSNIYALQVSRKNGIELRIRTKGEKLTVEPVS